MFEKEKENYTKYGIAKPEFEIWGDSLTGENYNLKTLLDGVNELLKDTHKETTTNIKTLQAINPLIQIKDKRSNR